MAKEIKQAFTRICAAAATTVAPLFGPSHFLSLYMSEPYFGGPEEGGWWGQDIKLMSYKRFPTEEAAEAAEEAVTKLAEELSADAKRDFGRQCRNEVDWCEARGLDADYLPEVDGEVSYFVVVEEWPGTMESEGCRQYE